MEQAPRPGPLPSGWGEGEDGGGRSGESSTGDSGAEVGDSWICGVAAGVGVWDCATRERAFGRGVDGGVANCVARIFESGGVVHAGDSGVGGGGGGDGGARLKN